MSEWTYVRGCMELSCSAYENKCKIPEPFKWTKNLSEEEQEIYRAWRRKWRRGLYLPYPEEQFKITVPTLLSRYKKPTKKDPSDYKTILNFHGYLYSLPRAKKYLETAFSMLPQGESGFRYSIKQDSSDSCSTSICSFSEDCLYKYFKDAINRLYYNEDPWHSWTFDDLRKYQKIDKSCSTEYVDSMVIGIVQPLRYATADELRSCLEKFFLYLLENDFDICNVYLEWHDNYEYCLRHTCRVDSEFDDIVFETINTQNNQVIYRRTLAYPRDEHGFIDYDKYDKVHPEVKEEELGERPAWSKEED